ncbi:mobilization protein [Rhizobiaceae bacterium n13]|uniref:mobilization protein n=1 Tax=Ferirhizobium litorale TaxID=2927786 RepID=UPI0024B2E5C0|nr:mobilization protein [Fererhizobium litorale]MDI7862376.1 mobilization protein [Fererhizobium litorale]
MVRKPIAQRIAELEVRKKALIARLSKQDRSRDTRRKILLGALLLHRLAHSGDASFVRRLRDWLRLELPGFLVRDGDRALFDDILDEGAYRQPDSGEATE